SLVLGLAGVLAVFIFCAWFFAHLDHQQAIRAVAPALKRLFQWVPWCAWLLNGLFVFKLGLAAWSWQASQRRGLLSGRILWTYVAVWLAGTFCLAALPLLFFFPLHQEPAGDPLDWVIHIGWLKYLFTLAALLLLPWARIGLAPLALASNRHR